MRMCLFKGVTRYPIQVQLNWPAVLMGCMIIRSVSTAEASDSFLSQAWKTLQYSYTTYVIPSFYSFHVLNMNFEDCQTVVSHHLFETDNTDCRCHLEIIKRFKPLRRLCNTLKRCPARSPFSTIKPFLKDRFSGSSSAAESRRKLNNKCKLTD